MKYLLAFSLLSMSANNFGMETIKNALKSLRGIKQKLAITYAPHNSEAPTQKEKTLPLIPELKQYQKAQRQNVNGIIFPLIFAGIFKINTNQSEPVENAYYYFTLATGISLGVAVRSVYDFCTLPLPKLEQKNK